MMLGLVLIAALGVASYEMWRRRGSDHKGPDPVGTIDPPPHILSHGGSDDDGDGDGGADGDGGS